MSFLFRLLQYKIWERGKGPANLYRWLLIIALAALYSCFFPSLADTFGTTARVFPALYLALAALSWGLRGAIIITVMNTVLNVVLHSRAGIPFEGGYLGPLGCLFATCLVGMLSDLARQLDEQIKARKKTETSMRDSETRYRTIFDTISEGVFIMDTDFVIVDMNDTASRMYGYEKNELIGDQPTQLIPSDYSDSIRVIAQSIQETGSYQSDAINLRKDGSPFFVEVRGSRIQLGGRDHYLAVISDVTEKVQADLELRESEEKYRQLFDMESDAIFMIETETGNILEVNTAASKLYGYAREELLDMRDADLSSEPDTRRQAVAIGQEPMRSHRKKDGTVISVEINARHFRWKGRDVHVAAIRDITPRMEAQEKNRRLEAQFYEAQKMESIGTLAGGIAHDFNNLLMSIMGNATMALLNLKPNERCSSYIENINRISKSGAELAKQLLGYARGGKYEPKPTDLNELILHQNQLFGRTCKNITIKSFCVDDLRRTEVDRGQIEQVLLNIYVNSQQAMPHGGEIMVRSENTLLDETIELPFPFTYGEYVKITIRDNGIGMDDKTQKRIFEPFFTTKEKGRGTGLGMASTYGIIKNHGGYIHVDSKLGEGTSIFIWLPVTDKDAVDEMQIHCDNIVKGSGTILLVDDEIAIIDVTLKMMQLLGYSVLTAQTGQEAIEIYQENQGAIDLVILDIIMPGMGGCETFDRLIAIDPEVNVLLSTGYSLDENASEILNRGCKDILHKPYEMGELSHKIDGILRPN